uniref:Uncharacterized protein n=1 Tax=Ciona intestinalis TaxID=7719 RepID=H2XV40_CIOIN
MMSIIPHDYVSTIALLICALSLLFIATLLSFLVASCTVVKLVYAFRLALTALKIVFMQVTIKVSKFN